MTWRRRRIRDWWLRLLRYFGLLPAPTPSADTVYGYAPLVVDVPFDYFDSTPFLDLLKRMPTDKPLRIRWLDDEYLPKLSSVAVYRDLWSDWRWVDA